MTTGNLSNYVKRNKVILSGDLIDDTLDINVAFLKKWSAKKSTLIDTPAAPKIELPDLRQPDPKIKTKRKKEDDGEGGSDWLSLEKQKKQLDIEKITEEIALLELKKEKLQGDNIPTVAVKDVFIRHNKSLLTNMKSGIENLIIKIESIAALSREQTGKIRGEMKTILNDALNNAIDETQSDLENIVSENTIKKGVGERE